MGEDLFENAAQERLRREAPLARRVAPRTLDDLLGQGHILGPGKILRRAIEADRITSLILYGPPGCGKTALARIIAMRTKSAFEPLNAVTSGVKDLRALIEKAKQRRIHEQRKTIVFVDEIHRFNRAQQDALLPDVENGNIVLIGATTENPFFSVVAPLLSRSQIFEFKRLDEDQLTQLLERALAHPELGLDFAVQAEDAALRHIALYAEGDVRRAMGALEVALLTTPPEDGVIRITEEVAKESIQRKMLHYDGSGDEHYDAASAMIKSMRGSNPDAALYWMARMLEAGETPRFVARRIVIAASEDVGNADPMALVVANNAWQACEFIGMPEARILLAQALTYVACAPKSNAAYAAIDAALAHVREEKTAEVPAHLQDGHYKGAKQLGRGIGYAYAHDHPEGYVTQDYGVPRGTFYHPTDRGKEAEFRERLARFDARDAGEEPES
ncbi:MAG: AAA family ATPase [Candidatus Hydrogenedens sp.]|nr:AAA family ATPase [Candidatus Hydrogenedens sp.]